MVLTHFSQSAVDHISLKTETKFLNIIPKAWRTGEELRNVFNGSEEQNTEQNVFFFFQKTHHFRKDD